ncbi:MAG: ABC transporter permease [Spirochaetales bacterium]|nr:ABC transporter permease [Spirochaetales bacterium]
MTILPIAIRNFVRNQNRYRLLLGSLALAVLVLVLILGVVSGMNRVLRLKAARYFAGDVSVLGYGDFNNSRIEDVESVLEVFRDLPWAVNGFAVRSLYYRTDASLSFGGRTSRQRRLIGLDWDRESSALETLDLFEGALPSPDDKEGILISSAVARSLGVRVGDDILVSGTTETGQINALTLVLRGVFEDASFFGYTAYLHISTLNSLKDLAPNFVNEMGVYVRNPGDQEKVAQFIHERLESTFPVFPIMQSKEERDRYFAQRTPITTLAVLTLDANLAQIRDLLGALSMVAFSLILLFLGIVMVGVSNTYTMLVHERTKEIGTMRALGMQARDVKGLFIFEAAFLGVAGAVLGFGLGLVTLTIVSQISFVRFSWASLFLQSGYLSWYLPPWGMAGVLLLVILSSMLGSYRSADLASRLNPVDALREE